jgi:hypothetical protein
MQQSNGRDDEVEERTVREPGNKHDAGGPGKHILRPNREQGVPCTARLGSGEMIEVEKIGGSFDE